MEKFKNIWTEVEPTVSLCDSLYQAVSSPLENLDAKKLYNLRTFFFRGIFEQACEQNNLDKKSYSKCIIHSFKQFILSTSAGSKLDEEKINKYAAQFFDATEIKLLESTPPLIQKAIGTSDLIRNFTAFITASLVMSTASE